ncbi:hypothetical protein TKK_0007544 [Trichogramma kaykai]|uniref:Malonyl-CoA decarboxylase n=1 Tax=Trichogramma kaykai TaxID=54128 RepID=A0ABD2WH63_9HYME
MAFLPLALLPRRLARCAASSYNNCSLLLVAQGKKSTRTSSRSSSSCCSLAVSASKANFASASYSSSSSSSDNTTTTTTTIHCPIVEELDRVIGLRTKNNSSSWVVESNVSALHSKYDELSKEDKAKFLSLLATRHAVNHDRICELSKKLACTEPSSLNRLLTREKALKDALQPPYHWFFARVGRLKDGVKFLVDMRANLLETMNQLPRDSSDLLMLSQMDATLKELLFLWFSVGFLKIERVTWETPCDILQKVSDYEAIHPVRNWTDLKKRVGPYRRCFIFTHPSMPREPLVVLHTALCDIIPESVKGIEESEKRIREKAGNKKNIEDETNIKAAIFYSIASTQSGLQGIELGNYLIKQVAKHITTEFPEVNQLSSLSPIPNFRVWLLDKIKRDVNTIFTEKEQVTLKNVLGFDENSNISSKNLYTELKKMFNNSLWSNNKQLTDILKEPLLRSCAWYLFKEKRRNYALNGVANFHLKNGAIMWRINWMADPTPRGMANSCGIMVNYRYYLNETKSNSTNYIENFYIKASRDIDELAKEAEKIMISSNQSV